MIVFLAEEHSIDGYSELNDPEFYQYVKSMPSLKPQDSLEAAAVSLKSNTKLLVDCSQASVDSSAGTSRSKHCTTM